MITYRHINRYLFRDFGVCELEELLSGFFSLWNAANSSDQTKDQDLLSHLMRNLASLAGATNERNTPGLLSAPPEQWNAGTSMGASKEVCTRSKYWYWTFLSSASDWIDLQDSLKPTGNCLIPASEVTEKRMGRSDVECGILQNPCAWQPDSLCCRKESSPINANASAKVKLNNIDLNNIYDDSQDGNQKLQNSDASANPGAASSGCPLWICHDPHKSSPGTSGNSGSTSSLSLSNSSGEAQVWVLFSIAVYHCTHMQFV